MHDEEEQEEVKEEGGGQDKDEGDVGDKTQSTHGTAQDTIASKRRQLRDDHESTGGSRTETTAADADRRWC